MIQLNKDQLVDDTGNAGDDHAILFDDLKMPDFEFELFSRTFYQSAAFTSGEPVADKNRSTSNALRYLATGSPLVNAARVISRL